MIDEVQLQQKDKKAGPLKHVLEKIHVDAIHQKTYVYTEEECLEAV